MKTSWYGFKVFVAGREIASVDASEYESVAAAREKAHEIGRGRNVLPGTLPRPYAISPVGTALNGQSSGILGGSW